MVILSAGVNECSAQLALPLSDSLHRPQLQTGTTNTAQSRDQNAHRLRQMVEVSPISQPPAVPQKARLSTEKIP